MQTIDINSLVRQILSDLAPKPVNVAPKTEAIPRIASRVVSLAELEKIGDAKKLIVSEKAVITPAVRDELRKRGIELVTENQQAITVGTEKLNVWLALHLQKKESTALFDFLAKNYGFEKATFDCILKTMDAAEEKLLAQSTSCVVLSGYSAAAMCVANRHANIRAVLGFDPTMLKADADQIGANLLVVDPVRSGPFKLQSLVKTFLADGVRKVPKFLLEDRGQRTEDR